jgi:hypothetical protein
MDGFRVAPQDSHGRARRGLSRTVMRRVGLSLQVACLIGGRLIWLVVADRERGEQTAWG